MHDVTKTAGAVAQPVKCAICQQSWPCDWRGLCASLIGFNPCWLKLLKMGWADTQWTQLAWWHNGWVSDLWSRCCGFNFQFGCL